MWIFEDCKLRVLENYSCPKENNIRWWRKVHKDELSKWYSLPNSNRTIKSRKGRWARQVVRVWEMTNVCKMLLRKPEWKRPLWRPGHTWEFNLKIIAQEIECKKWTTFSWLQINNWLQKTFEFYDCKEITSLAEPLAALQRALYSMELLRYPLSACPVRLLHSWNEGNKTVKSVCGRFRFRY
jgi:hypothetical protein